MVEIFGFLFFISLICLIIGIIKPSLFTRVFKKNLPRKKLGLIFGIASFIFFILIGATAPKIKTDELPKAKESVEASNTNLPTQVEATPTDNLTLNSEPNQTPKNTEVKTVETSQTVNPTQNNPSTTPTRKSSPATTIPQYTYYSVVSVVDGDTIKINLAGTQTTLRLIGIDTPETVDPRKPVQCFGREASNKAKELLSGKKVRIEKDQTQGELDKYGRTLAYVYRDDGLFYNKYMIEQGYAHEYTYNLPYKYQSEFKAAEKSARENQLGLWSPNTCNGDTNSVASQTTITAPSSGSYYTSSYYSSKYYYPENCSAWQGLSSQYLKKFSSLSELLSTYPSRILSPQCQ